MCENYCYMALLEMSYKIFAECVLRNLNKYKEKEKILITCDEQKIVL